MTEFFHAYDIRGTSDELGEKEMLKLGKSYGTFVDKDEVALVHDARKHSERHTQAFTEGLTSTGVDALVGGLEPTPVAYHAAWSRGIPAAAITASHNPPEYTGVKFASPGGVALSREAGMAEIQRIYESGEFDEGDGDADEVNLGAGYTNHLSSGLESDAGVVVDAGNGAGGERARQVLEEIGCDVRIVNAEPDGSFPDHLPDTETERLEEEVENELGVVLDGDADRAGFLVPGHGEVSPDEAMALFAEECLDGDGAVLADLRSSKTVRGEGRTQRRELFRKPSGPHLHLRENTPKQRHRVRRRAVGTLLLARSPGSVGRRGFCRRTNGPYALYHGPSEEAPRATSASSVAGTQA